ncbi:ORF72 [Ranid herpesvirus 2]|uniref:ORF72 n=1 Tax=Ranid herpesvirus 2 TaxID=389214 RepID=Q14W34_9VIRU|nr:ORF72 [Ranid herpesvirus 2]ABG25578.1 ORF72 [Ranid herpesvirus 2]
MWSFPFSILLILYSGAALLAEELQPLTDDTMTHTQCRVIASALPSPDATSAISSKSFKLNTVYYIPMDGMATQQNGVEYKENPELYKGFCMDGTLMSFTYRGSELVCEFAIYQKPGGKSPNCFTCQHYKQHHGTPEAMLSSTDACYSPNRTDAYHTSLRAFWADFYTGQLTRPSELFMYSADMEPNVASCLQSYVGISIPDSTGYCVRTLGHACYKTFCISSQEIAGGFTNRPAQTQGDTNMKLQCRINDGVSEIDYGKLQLCDVCVLEHLTINADGKIVVPLLYSNAKLHQMCNEVVLALHSNTPMTLESATTLLTWVALNAGTGQLHGLEVPWVHKSAVMIDALDKAFTVYRFISVSVRYDLDRMKVDSFVTELTNRDDIARRKIKYVTLVQGKAQTFDREGRQALAALLMYRKPLSVYYVVPFTSITSLESDLERIVEVRTVHLGAYGILTAAEPNHIYMASLRSAVMGRDSVQKSGAIDTNLLRAVKYYYYITTVRDKIYCPYISSYYNDIMLLRFPYENTERVPSMDVYWARENFVCAVGSEVIPWAQRCNFGSSIPATGISLLTLVEDLYKPGVPYLFKSNNCTLAEVTNGASCTFSEKPRTIHSQLYLANGRVSGAVTDFGTYHVGVYMTAKIINEMTDVVEIIPLQQTCTFLNISLLPTCAAAVCKPPVGQQADANCNSEVVCSLDTNVRTSMALLFDEFEYAKRRYKETIAVAEAWQSSKEPARHRRFAGMIMAGVAIGLSTIALGIAGGAFYYAKQADQKATQALDVAMRTRDVLLQVAEQTKDMKLAMEGTNKRVDLVESSVRKIGDTIFKLTNTMQAKLAETHSRISDLTDHVDNNFVLVRDAINTVATKLSSEMEAAQKAALYYQQMQSFTNIVVQSISRLNSQTQMYSTCLQNIDDGKLYGCPLSDPFINMNADYRMVSSVYGAIYDGEALHVVYKVPDSVELMTLYTVLVKPFMVNGILQVVDSSNVVMGPDGGFYEKPFCEGRYCMPLTQNTNFSKCLSMVQSGDTAQIARFCTMLPCNKIDCSDRMNIKTIRGTLSVPGTPLKGFEVLSFDYVDYRMPNLTLNKTPTFKINGTYDEIIKDLLDEMNKTIEGNAANSSILSAYVKAELDKIKPDEWIKQLNDPAFNYAGSGTSATVVTALVVMSVLLGVIVIGGAIFFYCRYKTNLARLSGQGAYGMHSGSFTPMQLPFQPVVYPAPPPPSYNQMQQEDKGVGHVMGGETKIKMLGDMMGKKKFNSAYRYKRL